MPFVQRDASGNVVGLYNNLQPGFAEESLADTDPAVTAYLTAQSIPKTVTAMQAKVALSRAGLLTQVQTWVNTQSAEDQLIWASAPSFSRGSALLNAAGAALNLDSSAMDKLFVLAAAINP